MEEKRDETKRLLRSVYDAEGKEYSVEPVDAKEYLATGRYTSSPPSKEPVYVHQEPAQAPVKEESGKKT